MAELLSQSREASARIRVENIIHADITVELMEILELYAELLLARAGLLDVRDKNIKDGIISSGSGGGSGTSSTHDDNTGLEEAAASLIYAAPRLPRDVRELPLVRNMLVDRFGKEFAVRANDNVDGLVPARVADKLKVDPPSQRLVQAYLEEIARTYAVDWPKHRETDLVDEAEREIEDEDVDNEDDDGVGGGAKETPILAESGQPPSSLEPAKTSTPATPKPNKIDIGNLQNATPPSDIGAKSPVSVAPPGARSDNPSPKVRLPGGGVVGGGKNPSAAKPIKKATTTTPATTTTTKPTTTAVGGSAVGGKVPTVDDLAKRFAALK
ncbi:hypothetical protein B0A52_02998 [Exophiala mesophila]|uniref:DUF292 domain protein n=1 Tax=Exophiala mesophila TaxID=212818 RepID=A0A438NC70_EXOME|nr:hypothetical protein B0A52_02998 [Exophiala mesophila]